MYIEQNASVNIVTNLLSLSYLASLQSTKFKADVLSMRVAKRVFIQFTRSLFKKLLSYCSDFRLLKGRGSESKRCKQTACMRASRRRYNNFQIIQGAHCHSTLWCEVRSQTPERAGSIPSQALAKKIKQKA